MSSQRLIVTSVGGSKVVNGKEMASTMGTGVTLTLGRPPKGDGEKPMMALLMEQRETCCMSLTLKQPTAEEEKPEMPQGSLLAENQ